MTRSFRITLILIFVTVALIIVKAMENPQVASIHKVWKFKKYDVVNVNLNEGMFFGSNDRLEFLDLTGKDSLHITTQNKISHNSYIPYKIVGDTLYIGPQVKFKIRKLTSNELVLQIPVPGKKVKKTVS